VFLAEVRVSADILVESHRRARGETQKRGAEANKMEFTIGCPIDGPVEVGLEDIDTVVLREQEQADITFICPQCGSQITVTAIVPAFLMAAIEALAEDSETASAEGLVLLSGDEHEIRRGLSDSQEARVEAYCEYFRRQLVQIDCVDDAIAEIDSKATS
jgi:hypothetical protein